MTFKRCKPVACQQKVAVGHRQRQRPLPKGYRYLEGQWYTFNLSANIYYHRISVPGPQPQQTHLRLLMSLIFDTSVVGSLRMLVRSVRIVPNTWPRVVAAFWPAWLRPGVPWRTVSLAGSSFAAFRALTAPRWIAAGSESSRAELRKALTVSTSKIQLLIELMIVCAAS